MGEAVETRSASAAHGDGHATAAPPLRFTIDQPAFIDFGSGRGESMRFAEGLMQGPGSGIEIAPDRIAVARQAGYDVVQADMLNVDLRGVAPAAFAVDLMPELEGRRAFEAALSVMLRAARDFALVQHLCFDSAETLFARGLTAMGHADKSIRFRPRAVDYVHFVQNYASRLELVGLAVFGIGDPKTEPGTLHDLRGPLLATAESRPVYRSIRVIIGRKANARFRAALRRAGTGDGLLMWEAPV